MDRAGYPLEKSVLDMFSAFADRVEILPVDLSLKNAEGHQVPAEEVAEDDSSQMSHSIPTIQVSEVDTASANSGCSYKHFLIKICVFCVPRFQLAHYGRIHPAVEESQRRIRQNLRSLFVRLLCQRNRSQVSHLSNGNQSEKRHTLSRLMDIV